LVYLRFAILIAIKVLAKTFYRMDARAIDGGPVPGHPWNRIRLVCLLNHTSLYEPLLAAGVPNRFLWEIARRAMVPVAEVTLDRPILGRFLKLLIARPVSITREPDHTWDLVLNSIDEQSMVIILPEGRMRRGDGLDRQGRPMTSRGGVATILQTIPSGHLLMAYSGGLHHVQIPGQWFPRLFKTIRLRFELLEIASYRAEMETQAAASGSYKNAVKQDLDRRRDRYSPMTPESTRQPKHL
jgi:hypothetical protein